MKLFKTFKDNESGATSISYVVMTAGLAILATNVVSTIKLGLHDNVNGIVSAMTSTGAQSTSTGTQGTWSAPSNPTTPITSAADTAIANLVHQMVQEQFPNIPPDQIKYLLPSQLAAMTSAWWFGKIPAASKKMLSADQIQAVPPSVIGPNAGELTSEQIGWLTSDQFGAVKGGDAIVNMIRKHPSMVSKLSRDQAASIKNSWWLGQLVTSAGSNLSKPQIQAALPSALGPNAGKLTSEQIGWLTPDQIRAVKGSDALVNMLTKAPDLISKITPTQIATIQNPWWFGHMPTPVLQAMNEHQVKAIPTNIYPSIKRKFTPTQQAWRQ
jgi:Flp pilus assembly protein, pilin Flp